MPALFGRKSRRANDRAARHPLDHQGRHFGNQWPLISGLCEIGCLDRVLSRIASKPVEWVQVAAAAKASAAAATTATAAAAAATTTAGRQKNCGTAQNKPMSCVHILSLRPLVLWS